ncbi:hypothetical protein [Aureliella helgolandensis]|uniref:Uncharacterized protein n=1 Tax=Aureliella helgolandensis TaxID=2527968 RepID=A0A518G4R8_9BACT|nr:hypothetical protein [Aureliella helgolandensis]QDV23591.1 hypothetical protein Q31a_18930 [Aureliella helgolandensis]
MAILVREIAGMSGSEGADEASATLVFDLKKGAADSMAAVRAAVVSETPATFDGLDRTKFTWREEEENLRLIVNVDYSARLPESTLRRSFDSTGGTVRVFTSLDTASFVRPGRTAPNFRSLIGIKDGDPEGVDKTVPALKLSYSYKWPSNVINNAYVKALAGLVGMTNSATWDTYGAGELLFLGASGEIIPNVPTTISYSYAASADVTGLTIADITGVAKGGHDYLRVAYEEEADATAKKKIRRPLAAYVERIYGRTAFSSFGII